MRIVLELDAPWRAISAKDGETLAFARDDVPARLSTTPLHDRFVTSRRPQAENVHLEVIGETQMRSALGWPVHVIEHLVTSNGAPRRELEARYECLEFGGSVIVIGPVDSMARHRDDLLAAALSARPDWSSSPASIAELLAGAI